jgi:DNA-directed RNA polymerase specialized sigma24 family protein
MPEPPRAARFPTTHWSRVVTAGDPAAPGAKEALADLCAAYWYPLYAFIRRQGQPPEAAADLTQDYFARLLEKGVLAAADRHKGRFRAFLRTDCGFFLADAYDRLAAQKRGGGRALLSIDEAGAEGRYRLEPTDLLTPDRLFDRAWALTLLERVFERLRRESADAGRRESFERLAVVLTDGPRSVSYAVLADELGMTVAAVESAVRRLRGRYRDLLRAEIAATLDDPSDAAVAGEIQWLFVALKP